MPNYTVIQGDARRIPLADNSVDSIVCDPPYGLEFMGKNWDAPWRQGEGLGGNSEATFSKTGYSDGGNRLARPSFIGGTNATCRTCGKSRRRAEGQRGGPCRCVTPDFPNLILPRMKAFQEWCETWATECLRVLKPGGHLLAFGGSRTYHRLACAIEDAGFEIRDQIQWIYGSGFPKSLDVSKAIDAAAGAEREVIGIVKGMSDKPSGMLRDDKWQPAGNALLVTTASTDDAKQWEGWGTALKPAHEPIVLARKPLIGTVAENVLQHGTGGLNIDGCRIEGIPPSVPQPIFDSPTGQIYGFKTGEGRNGEMSQATLGRWPANVITDGSDEVLAGFPDAPGQQGDLSGHSKDRLSKGIFGDMKAARDAIARLDSGSAARFFYCAKSSQEDRNEGLEDLPMLSAGDVTDRVDGSAGLNSPRAGAGRTNGSRNPHPTVKPTELMRYLCRLVTPPGGLVCDPFCGSGSTGRGATLEGLRFVGIELSAEYCEIAKRRIEAVTKQGLLFA